MPELTISPEKVGFLIEKARQFDVKEAASDPDSEDATYSDLLEIDLKYGRNRERIITDLRRISKPGRRVYARKDRLPRVLGGMGTAILSTSHGVMTSRNAEREGIGGEVICFVW